MSEVPTIKLDVISVPVTAKPRKLRATWTFEELDFGDLNKTAKRIEIIRDPIKKLMKNIGYAVEPDEIKEIETQAENFEFEHDLSEQIKKEIDQEILKELQNYHYYTKKL